MKNLFVAFLIALVFNLLSCLGSTNSDSHDEDHLSSSKETLTNSSSSSTLSINAPPILSLEFKDFITDKIIEEEITLFAPKNFSDAMYNGQLNQIDSITFRNGLVNIALKKGENLLSSGEHHIYLHVRSDNYNSREFRFFVPDSGTTFHTLSLVHKLDDLPHLQENVHLNPVDELGNTINTDTITIKDPNSPTAYRLSNSAVGSNYNISEFAIFPSRPSVYIWALFESDSSAHELSGPYQNIKTSTVTWTKIPELVSPVIPKSSNDPTRYIPLMHIRSLTVQTESSDSNYIPLLISDTSSTAYMFLPAHKMIMNLSVVPGDFLDGTTWLNDYKASVVDGTLQSVFFDLAAAIASIYFPYPYENNFYRTLPTSIYAPQNSSQIVDTWGIDTNFVGVFGHANTGSILDQTVSFQIALNSSEQFPLFTRFSTYGQLKYVNLPVKINNLPASQQRLSFTVLAAGIHTSYNHIPSDTTLSLPATQANITLQLPSGNITYYEDLTHATSLTIDIPNFGTNTENNVKATANIKCAQGTSFIFDELYNTSVRYHLANSDNPWQISSMLSWIHSGGKLTGVLLEMDNIVLDRAYDIQLVGGGEVTQLTKTLNESDNSFDFEVDAKLCK